MWLPYLTVDLLERRVILGASSSHRLGFRHTTDIHFVEAVVSHITGWTTVRFKIFHTQPGNPTRSSQTIIDEVGMIDRMGWVFGSNIIWTNRGVDLRGLLSYPWASEE